MLHVVDGKRITGKRGLDACERCDLGSMLKGIAKSHTHWCVYRCAVEKCRERRGRKVPFCEVHDPFFVTVFFETAEEDALKGYPSSSEI